MNTIPFNREQFEAAILNNASDVVPKDFFELCEKGLEDARIKEVLDVLQDMVNRGLIREHHREGPNLLHGFFLRNVPVSA